MRGRLVWLVTFGVAAAFVVWLLRPRAEFVKPYYRFVDPQLRRASPADGTQEALREAPTPVPLATADYPLAILGDEARYVLTAPPRATALYAEAMAVPATGRLQFHPALPADLGEAERILVVPKVRAGRVWRDLPKRVVAAESSNLGRNVSFELDFPGELAGTNVAVNIDVFAIPRHSVSVYETPVVLIPGGATLEFATGILEPAWFQGSVEFLVHACVKQACELLRKDVVDPTTPSGQAWRNHRISLRALAGTQRAFVFETRVLSSTAGVFSFPVWGNPTVYATVPRPTGVKNVILISLDTLSARHLSLYGYGQTTTPFLDAKFGEEGVVFENCEAAATTTPPSHMSMFTSLPPCAHGLTTGFEVMSPTRVTLAEVLRANSYETGAVTEDGWLDVKFAFGRGFNMFAENKSAELLKPVGQIEQTFDRARRWLVRHRDKPFFLFVHTFQVHAPYTPPDAYRGLFREYDGQVVSDTAPQVLRERANYDREIRYTDDQLRLLWQTISDLGLTQNTIVIITSDHGEEFLEHGHWGHGADLYEEVTSVPLMLWLPRNETPGRRVREVVGHIDLLPTILDLLGVPIPAQASGMSLVRFLHGEANVENAGGRALFSEAWADFAVAADGEIVGRSRPSLMVRRGHDKLVRLKEGDGFRYELYNLATDPLEKVDVFANSGGGELRGMIDAYETECARVAGVGSQGGAEKPERAQLEPGQEEKLRALGYLK